MLRLLLLACLVALPTPLVFAQSASSPQPNDLRAAPERERELIGILMRARDQFRSARTAEARKDVRLNMQLQEARFAAQSPLAAGWTGTILQARTNPDGFAWVRIEISPDIVLSTAKSREVDPHGQTLIPAGTKLYDIASRLITGQTVKFDATLIGGRLGSDEAMVTRPEVTVRFTSLKPLD